MKRYLPWFTLAGAFLGAVLSQVALGAPPAQASVVPHPVAGREACLSCHTSGSQAMPADHAGRTQETCLTCHSAGQAEPAGPTPTPVSPTVSDLPTRPPTEPPATLPPISPAEYKGPEFCAQCHRPHIQEWQNSTHARAFQDPVFQASWAENRKPGYCLACHATGYNPNTGLPVAEGVTCESCHGTYREGHPQTDMMPVDPAAEKCGICHTSTYQEWQLSGHSQRGVKCASCHAVHSQGLLFPTSTALCATCHGDRAEDFAHAAHAQYGVTCADCHVYRPPEGSPSGGTLPTGHFFGVTSEACTQCHTRDTIHSRREEFAPASEATIPLMQRITALETEVQDLQGYATRNLVLGLVGGALGGLLIGVLVALLLQRR